MGVGGVGVGGVGVGGVGGVGVGGVGVGGVGAGGVAPLTVRAAVAVVVAPAAVLHVNENVVDTFGATDCDQLNCFVPLHTLYAGEADAVHDCAPVDDHRIVVYPPVLYEVDASDSVTFGPVPPDAAHAPAGACAGAQALADQHVGYAADV